MEVYIGQLEWYDYTTFLQMLKHRENLKKKSEGLLFSLEGKESDSNEQNKMLPVHSFAVDVVPSSWSLSFCENLQKLLKKKQENSFFCSHCFAMWFLFIPLIYTYSKCAITLCYAVVAVPSF